MNTFKLAVAQVPSVKGNVERNVATYLRAIAAALAFRHDDPRLAPLIEAAMVHRLHIILGAPLAGEPLPRIGALTFSPTGEVSSYAKMHLHAGEERYFSAGDTYRRLDLGAHTLAIAVCADTGQAAHVRACVAQGADVYLAGMLVSANGYEHDAEELAGYARDHGILVAMANHNRPTGGLAAVGKSAMWTAQGLLARAGERQSALVIARMTAAGWVAEVIEL